MVPGPWYWDLHDLDHTRGIAWQEGWMPLCQAHSLNICLCTCLLLLTAGPSSHWAHRETIAPMAPGPSFSSDWGDWEEDRHRIDK